MRCAIRARSAFSMCGRLGYLAFLARFGNDTHLDRLASAMGSLERLRRQTEKFLRSGVYVFFDCFVRGFSIRLLYINTYLRNR